MSTTLAGIIKSDLDDRVVKVISQVLSSRKLAYALTVVVHQSWVGLTQARART
jgi:hypothetical protein